MSSPRQDPVRLLLVEDDLALGASLAEALRADGYQVDWVRDALTARAALLAGSHHLAVLDRRLPDQDGLRALAAAREAGIDTPTLVLTARDSIEDRVDGLHGGADDYLIKPCDLRELRARLAALQRRASARHRRVLEHGPLRLDPDGHHLELGGQTVEVTPSEFRLLQLLVEESGAVVSRRRIAEHLYGVDGEPPESDAIKVHVHNLRRKLGAERIITVRGVGYAIAEPW